MIEEVFVHVTSDRKDIVVKALHILTTPEYITQYIDIYKLHLNKIQPCFPHHPIQCAVLLMEIQHQFPDIITSDTMNIKELYQTILTTIHNTLSTPVINLCCMLLNNISIIERNIEILVEIFDDNNDNTLLTTLFESYLHHNPQEETSNDNFDQIDKYQHIGGVLCNMSSCEIGRKHVVKVSNGYLPKLIQQIRSKNVIRRRGAVSTIKNILFDTNIHWWMIHESNALTTLLIHLVAPTPFTSLEKTGMDPLLWMLADDPDKEFESDVNIRKMLLECLLLLCQTRSIRTYLRNKKVYPIIRNLDYAQEDESVSALILELVQFLMRDEDPSSTTTDEVSTEEEKVSIVSSIGIENSVSARSHLTPEEAELQVD
jgi:hypothetical protein